MAQRGKPSTAHEYNDQNCCMYCGVYKSNVEAMSLVCTPEREAESDKAVAESTQEGTAAAIESPYGSNQAAIPSESQRLVPKKKHWGR